MVVIFTRAYNAARTIRRTIESILNQTYSDFRYILFDNGSVDETLNIMKEFARRDRRIIILSREDNQVTFRANLDILNFIVNNFPMTDYFCNIDADDRYELDFFEKMVGFSEQNMLEVAFCGYQILERGTGRQIAKKKVDDSVVIDHDDLPIYFKIYRPYTTDMWAKLFRISLLDNYLQKDRFAILEKRNHTQQNFIYDALASSAKIGMLDEVLFSYYESNAHQKNMRMQGNVSHLQAKDIYLMMKEFLDGIPSDYGVKKWNEAYLYAIYCGYIRDILEVTRLTNALSLVNKVNFVYEIFKYYVIQEMLAYDAPEEFYSLRLPAKQKMCDDIITYFKAQDGWEVFREKIKQVENICTLAKGENERCD